MWKTDLWKWWMYDFWNHSKEIQQSWKESTGASEFAYLISFLPAALASKPQVKTWQINHHKSSLIFFVQTGCRVGESHTAAQENSAWQDFSPLLSLSSPACTSCSFFWCVIDAIFRYVSKHVHFLPNPLFETCFATFHQLNENIPWCPQLLLFLSQNQLLCTPISVGSLEMHTSSLLCYTFHTIDANK